MKMRALALALLAAMAGALGAAEYTVDPLNGDDAADGTAERPWASLSHPFADGLIESRQWEGLPYEAGKALVPRNPGAPIRGGDTIWLRSGYYGGLSITGYYNETPITLAAAEGQEPRFPSILVRSGSNWVLRGLSVSPEYAPEYERKTLISLESHGWQGPISDITVEDCSLQSVADSSGWSAEDWNARACNGFRVDGTRMTIRNNRLLNVDFGISVDASHSHVEGNLVENFSGDGMRGLGDYTVFEYNTVKNCYDVNANHDDGFQSWTVGPDGVGTGEVVGIVLRGNTIINYDDPNQPHRGALQGIGCFDGMFVDWVVENNLVVVDHWHGITLGGARNCRIVNNTIADPEDPGEAGPAWLLIGAHKNKTPSEGCLVANNLVSALNQPEGQGVEFANNIVYTDPAEVFVDPGGYDFRLRPGSVAIDAGRADVAPELDITGEKRAQGGAPDVGAYEVGK